MPRHSIQIVIRKLQDVLRFHPPPTISTVTNVANVILLLTPTPDTLYLDFLQWVDAAVVAIIKVKELVYPSMGNAVKRSASY